MIADYKRYHGTVLAELVDGALQGVKIRAVNGGGRLLNYVLDERVVIHVRFSTQRLRPWRFAFTSMQISEIGDLLLRFEEAFVVLVCGFDGFVAIPAVDVLPQLQVPSSWLRVDRKKRHMYRVYGPNGEFDRLYLTTLEPVLSRLQN